MTRVRSTIITLALVWALSPAARAQVDAGSIVGTVHDQTGAAVPGASVVATETKTNATTTATTDAAGNYVATPLRIGTYSLSVEAPGFRKKTRDGIVLRVQDRLRVNFDLEVGGVAETLVVSGEAPVVQTETSSLGEVVDARQIVDLPLNGRNYVDLAILTSGVIRTLEGNNGNVGGSFVTNGARGTLNNFILDGIDNNSNDNGTNVIQTPVDALEEFKIQTSNYSAEFGRSGGAVINASIKSGTNDISGSAFYFLRDESLDARQFFEDPAEPKAPFHFQQFGGSLGGPIRKDKTFFFFDYQGERNREAGTAILTVPTEAQRRGDFSEEGNSTIYDPLTGEPFPGNVIPSSRISPISQAFANLYPNPNRPGLRNNYLTNPELTSHVNQGDLRIDHIFSGTDRAFLRFSMSRGQTIIPQPLPGLANGGDYGTGNNTSNTYGASLGYTHTFSSTVVNELRVGFSKLNGTDGISLGGQKLPPPELRIPGVIQDPRVDGVTVFSPANYSFVGDPEFIPTYADNGEIQFSDSLSLVRGRHSLKTGIQLRRSSFDIFQIAQPRGKLSFSGEFTQSQDSPDGTGDSMADALLGLASQLDISTLTGVKNRTPIFGAFVQDDFKVNDALTLNVGLRYDYVGPTVEKDNRQSNFDYATGKIIVAGQDGNSRGLISVDKLSFAPRLGFAWSPDKSGKTAIRGGWGRYFSPQEVRTGFQLGYNPPFLIALSQSSDFGVTPATTIDEGFPALDASATPFVLTADQRFRSPYYDQWNLSVQRQLPFDTLFEIAYVGSKGRRLQVMLDRNQPAPGPGDPQERRPYPAFGDFGSISNTGKSKFNSLQLKVSKRYTHGLWFLSAFTYGKATNDMPEICCASPWPQNSLDVAAEVGRADFDQRYRSVTSLTWDLPFGKGRKFMNRDGALNAILGGWQIGGIVTIGSGFPFSPHIGVDTSNTGTFGALRPDALRDGNLPSGQRTPQQWFDVSAFATPADFTFGNAKRNSLEGPGIKTADLFLKKAFRVSKTGRLELRIEAFNAFNHPNFGLPESFVDAGEGAAGVITSTSIKMRQVQFGVRYVF